MFICYKPDKLLRVSYINEFKSPDAKSKHSKFTASEYIIYIIKEGTLKITEDNHLFELSKGHVLFLLPGLTYQGIESTNCNYYHIHIPADMFTGFDCSEIGNIQKMILDNRNLSYCLDPFCDELYEQSKVLIPRDMIVKQPSALLKIETLLNDAILAYHSRSENYKLISSCRVLEFLSLLSGIYSSETLDNTSQVTTVSKNAGIVQAVFDLITTEYSAKITGEYISSRLGLSFDHLNRIFKKHSGITIFSYLNSVRINKSKELLLDGHYKSYEIARMTGFCDEYHFSKMFKKETGVPPAKWADL